MSTELLSASKHSSWTMRAGLRGNLERTFDPNSADPNGCCTTVRTCRLERQERPNVSKESEDKQ